MLLSSNAYDIIGHNLVTVVIDKLKSKDFVNWERQFSLTRNIFDILYVDLSDADKSLINQYRRVMLTNLTEDKKNALIEYCQDTDKIMTFLVGRLGHVVSFLANHSDGRIKLADKLTNSSLDFGSIYQRGDDEFWFDYCKEIVSLERLLEFAKESYRSMEQSGMEK